MKTSESTKALYAAFRKFTESVGVIYKTQKVKFGTTEYMHAKLEDVMNTVTPVLKENGMFYTQTVDICDTCAYVETIIHHIESEEWMACRVPVLCKDLNNPQAMGSGITYARRYGLVTICRLEQEDDDGKKASKKPLPKAKDAVLKSDKGVKFICGHGSAVDAIAAYEKACTLTQAQKSIIADIYKKSQQGGEDVGEF